MEGVIEGGGDEGGDKKKESMEAQEWHLLDVIFSLNIQFKKQNGEIMV